MKFDCLLSISFLSLKKWRSSRSVAKFGVANLFKLPLLYLRTPFTSLAPILSSFCSCEKGTAHKIAKAVSIILFIIINTFYSLSQELPVYQMYLLRPSMINPAFVGSTKCSSIALVDRHQWIGIKQAPSTQAFVAEYSPEVKGKNWYGIGANIYGDRNDANKQYGGDVNYAFHFIANKKTNLHAGLGLRASIIQWVFDESDFTPVYDPLVTGTSSTYNQFDASVGMYLYTDKFFLGLSGLNLIPRSSANAYHRNRYFYLYTGFFISDPHSLMAYNPSFAFKTNDSGAMQADLNYQLIYQKRYRAQVSYRHNFDEFPGNPNSLITYLGIDFERLTVAYGFDLGLTSLQTKHWGSHEFMLCYRFCPPAFPCPVFK